MIPPLGRYALARHYQALARQRAQQELETQRREAPGQALDSLQPGGTPGTPPAQLQPWQPAGWLFRTHERQTAASTLQACGKVLGDALATIAADVAAGESADPSSEQARRTRLEEAIFALDDAMRVANGVCVRDAHVLIKDRLLTLLVQGGDLVDPRLADGEGRQRRAAGLRAAIGCLHGALRLASPPLGYQALADMADLAASGIPAEARAVLVPYLLENLGGLPARAYPALLQAAALDAAEQQRPFDATLPERLLAALLAQAGERPEQARLAELAFLSRLIDILHSPEVPDAARDAILGLVAPRARQLPRPQRHALLRRIPPILVTRALTAATQPHRGSSS